MTKEENLLSLLKNIFKSESNIDGIMSMLETDEQRQILIEELENGLDEPETIILMACDIADGLEV